MGKYLNRHFIKDDIQIFKKHIKKDSALSSGKCRMTKI